ncbi:MAG: protein kinase [Myxococcales bacterium]|nr:protein kinase [Myxococcales bacterium]
MGLLPEYIGPYRVLRLIDRGGMAEVYEVQDQASGERLALKLLVAVRAALDRFDREYEAMTRLNHPGIVRVYHYGLHQGHPWLTMELLRGAPAQSHVKRVGHPGTPQRLREVLRLGYHVSMALNYIHDRKLVHRDLKSANVMVLPDDRIKLLDFGTAHLADSHRITQEGEFVGTFAYASPEQIMARGIDHRSDLYSLGVLLFRLATGRRPFASRDTEALIRAHLQQEPPDPRALVSNLPEELCQIIGALLAKHPDDRPRSAERVALGLEAIHGRPFTTRSRLAIHNRASASRGEQRRELWRHVDGDELHTLVVVEGDDGSDRVRFLDTLRQDATQMGWNPYLCMLRRGDSLRRVLQTLTALGGDCDAEAAEPLLEALRRCSTEVALADKTSRAILQRSAADLIRLRASGEEGATMLLVQEVHRSDRFTLELLGAMSRALQGEGLPFRLVVSCRSSVLQDRDFAARLGSCHRLFLPPLSPRQIAVAVGNMLGRRPPPAELARQLFVSTNGQPLYLEQAVQVMVASGGIEARDSRLAWADQAMRVPTPEAARIAAWRCLADVPVIWRRVLEVLALGEDACSRVLVAKVLGWRLPQVSVVLECLHEAGVLRWEPSEELVQWRHPMLPHLLRERIHPCRAAVIRRRLAIASRERPPTKGGVGAMVAMSLIHDAARSAIALSHDLMKGHQVRSALEMLEPVVKAVTDADRGPEIAALVHAYGECLRRVRPTDPTNGRTLARLRRLAEHDGNEAMLSRADLAQARLFKAIGHYRNYRKYLEQGWQREVTQRDPTLGAPMATELARSYRWHGDLHGAEQWVEHALGSAEASGDLSLLGDAVVQSAACMLARGHVADAEQAYTLAMEDFDKAGDRPGFWGALARWASSLRLQGRYSEALAQLYQRLPEASQSQDTTPYVELLQSVARVELDLSRLGRAQEYTDELVATLSRGEHLHLRIRTKLLRGRILLASGQLRTAAYLLEEVQQSARNADLVVLAEQARAILAEAMFHLGDERTASTLFQSSILGLLGSGDATVLAEGVQCRARVLATSCNPSDIFRPVTRLVEEQPMRLLRLEQLLARGAWHREQGELERSRQAFREAAMVLNVLATSLNDTDRAALRVHPWSMRIRRGLQQETH